TSVRSSTPPWDGSGPPRGGGVLSSASRATRRPSAGSAASSWVASRASDGSRPVRHTRRSRCDQHAATQAAQPRIATTRDVTPQTTLSLAGLDRTRRGLPVLPATRRRYFRVAGRYPGSSAPGGRHQGPSQSRPPHRSGVALGAPGADPNTQRRGVMRPRGRVRGGGGARKVQEAAESGLCRGNIVPSGMERLPYSRGSRAMRHDVTLLDLVRTVSGYAHSEAEVIA